MAVPSDMDFGNLLAFLSRVPPIAAGTKGRFGTGSTPEGSWWVKFTIAIDHPLAWQAVQELGHVLNYMSLNERLPTVFKPVSPPPYLNGGPEFLSWVIECELATFSPDLAAKWLEGRLPRPVDDESQWSADQ